MGSVSVSERNKSGEEWKWRGKEIEVERKRQE